MNSSVEKLEGNRIRLTVSHTAAEVDAAIVDAYSRVSRKIKLPGFRPGKAPRPIIDTHVGRDSVLAEALEQLIESSYPKALDANDLRPISRPDTGELDLLEEGKDYTYTAEVNVRPELTLSSIEDLKAVVPPSQTSDAEIDAQIEYLRDRFATLEVVEDRGIADGDYALLSFTGTVDGEAADDLTVEKYLYQFGAGIMPPEFDAALIGAKAGDNVHVEFPVPETASNPDYVGKTAAFDAEVHEVKAKFLPSIDDEFAVSVGGFETIVELREDIRARLNENKATAHTRLVEREAVADLAKRLEGEVPAELVSSRAGSLAEDFFESLRERQLTIEDYTAATGVPADQIQGDIAREAEARVRDELALEALYRATGLSYSEEELDEELEKLAMAEKVPASTLRERLIDSGVMALVRERLVQRHATRWLMDHVEIVEQAPTPLVDAEEPKPKKKGTSTKKPAKKKTGEAKED